MTYIQGRADLKKQPIFYGFIAFNLKRESISGCFAYRVVFCVPPLSIKYFTVFQEVEMEIKYEYFFITFKITFSLGQCHMEVSRTLQTEYNDFKTWHLTFLLPEEEIQITK